MAVNKFSAYTLGTACVFSLLGFDTLTQAASLSIQTPDIKVVQYIKDLPSISLPTPNIPGGIDIPGGPIPVECVSGVSDTLGVAALPICSALDISQNPEPPTFFTEQSWEEFKASNEYRTYIQIPSFTVFSDGQNIVNYTQFNQEFNPGFTPDVIGDVIDDATPYDLPRTYSPSDVYTGPYNGSNISPLGSSSLGVTNRGGARVSDAERVQQFEVADFVGTGYDAPFVYTEVEEVIPADGSPIRVTVNRSEFPTTRLYINNQLIVPEKAQVSDLSNFFVSGGTVLNPPGEGNFAPAGDSISVSVSPEIDSTVGFGTTNGTFDTIRPVFFSEQPDVVEGEGTNQLLFQDLAQPPNSLTFEGASFEDAEIGETIVLGTLSYKNGTLTISGLITDSTYTSNLTISSDSTVLTPFDFNQSFTELLTLITTPNIGTPEQNADILFFSNLPELGSFRVLEGETGTVELFGTFGSLSLTGFGAVVSGPGTGFVDPTPIPEPSSALGTLAYSVLGGSLLLKRKLKK